MSQSVKREQDRQILALIKAAGRDGIGYGDLRFGGFTDGKIGGSVVRLIALGDVFKATIGHRTVRLFANIDWSSAYAAERRAVGLRTSTSAGWPAGEKAHYPHHADGSPAYKYTVVPPPHRPDSMPIRTTHYQPW